MQKRILALDVGTRRIGIAVSDPLRITAQAVGTYNRKGVDDDYKYISNLLDQYQPEFILLGLPNRTDGKSSDIAADVKAFGDGIAARCGMDVRYHDERFTTAMAQKTLIEANVRREKRKDFVDTVAAVIILQSFLDSHSGV